MRTHQSGFSIIKFLLIVLILIGALGTFFYIKLQGNRIFPISTIKIASGYERISKTHLKKVIAHQIQKENFLTLNINQLKKEILNIAWVHDAVIRRAWPGTLLIRIEEQKPIALFNGKAVFNQKGELFHPPIASIPKHLPQIVAHQNDYKIAWQIYQKMGHQVQLIKLKIVFLELNFDGNLKVVLNNGVSLLVGKTELFRRWNRFISAYSKLNQEALLANKRIGQIDLRYTNGFAVRWTPNLKIQEKAKPGK